jgi:hypothetical protein
MTLRQYLLLMAFGTALAWTAVGIVVTSADPAESQAVVFAVLYAAVLLALTGTFSIAGLALRVWLLSRQTLISRQVAISFRQSVLLSMLLTVALILKGQDLLTWWTALLLIAAITVLEFFFISAKLRM